MLFGKTRYYICQTILDDHVPEVPDVPEVPPKDVPEVPVVPELFDVVWQNQVLHLPNNIVLEILIHQSYYTLTKF